MPTLNVVQPFNFNLTLKFLNAFPPMQGEQNLHRALRKATCLNGQTVGFVVQQRESKLTCELHPERPLTPQEETDLLERISFFLALGDDLHAFYQAAQQDQPFKAVLDNLHGFHQPRFLTPFEVACWAVIHQRMPLAQARKVKLALCQQFGGEWDGLPAFPEPRDLAHLTESDFMKIIANERKARALAEITAAFQGVTTAELVQKPYEEISAWLRSIYGIGEWSTLFILVRGLGRLQNIVVQDRESPFLKEMQRAARPIYGELTPEQLWAQARRYGEQQGQWAIYLRSFTALCQLKENAA